MYQLEIKYDFMEEGIMLFLGKVTKFDWCIPISIKYLPLAVKQGPNYKFSWKFAIGLDRFSMKCLSSPRHNLKSVDFFSHCRHCWLDLNQTFLLDYSILTRKLDTFCRTFTSFQQYMMSNSRWNHFLLDPLKLLWEVFIWIYSPDFHFF